MKCREIKKVNKNILQIDFDILLPAIYYILAIDRLHMKLESELLSQFGLGGWIVNPTLTQLSSLGWIWVYTSLVGFKF